MAEKGVTVWFTGMSGSGKTTIAKRLEAILKERGVRVERLDGDVVREGLTRDLGFSKEDREKNIERVSFVAELLTRHGVIVLASFISPYAASRQMARERIGSFLEVHVHAPLEVLIERDVKGLYKKAIAGEIPHFTGISDPYEPPESPDLVVRTDQEEIEASVRRVLELLEDRGFLSPQARISASRPGRGEPAAAPPAASDETLLPLPHGGRLEIRELKDEALEEAVRRAGDYRRVRLDEVAESDVELLAVGALSPLTGFMDEAAYRSVVEHMRLPNGLPWTLPITLSVSRLEASDIAVGETVTLLGCDGEAMALLTVESKFETDKGWEARRVYGTEDADHPGVARIYRRGDVLLGGPVQVIRRTARLTSAGYRLTPLETRRAFVEKGWRHVAAFQTRNPVHRAHEYLQKVAMELVDGLLLHPLVGATKADDVPAEVRMRSYEVLLKKYYPSDRALLAVFPAAMRYAGPREAVFHAIVRKNYGCSHFIVGRDHAGVGNYYGTYDAQKIFDQFSPAELGVAPLKFEHAFYCKACGNMATSKTCPHDPEERLTLSGTRVRQMLRDGEPIPVEFTRPEVAQALAAEFRELATKTAIS